MVLNHLDRIWERLSVILETLTKDFEMDELANLRHFFVFPIALNLTHFYQ